MPDWKSPATIERLVAALIASNGGKVDNHAIARYMDESFDAIENKTRVFKREAQKLVKEAEETGRIHMDMRKRAKDCAGGEGVRGGVGAGAGTGTGTGTATATPRKGRGTPRKGAAGGKGAEGELRSVRGSRVEKTPTKKPRGGAGTVKLEEAASTDGSEYVEGGATGATFAFDHMAFSEGGVGLGGYDDWSAGIV